MSKVIFFGMDMHGHVNPSLGLVRTLIERGEEVVYYSEEAFRAKIEETGAAFRSYEGLLSFGTYEAGGISTFLVTADFILDKSRSILQRFGSDMAAFGPDYIVHDAFCYWGREAAQQLNVPGVSFFANFAYIDEMSDIDPEFFMEHILRASEDPVYKKFKGNPDFYKKFMNKVSAIVSGKYGLQPINVINDIFCSKEELNILLTSREFQIYADAFDESYLFAGYPIHQREEPDFPYEKLDGRTLVYISFGTIFNEVADIYRTCIEAFRHADKQVVLSIGNSTRVEELGDIPDHIIVRNQVPQLEILRRADVFITHGGANSVHEGICFGKPLVVVPQSFDQFMGALTVEKAGTGIYMKSSGFAAAELAEAVESVLTTAAYQANCERIRDSFLEAGGFPYAVEQIFAYVARKREAIKLKAN